MRAMKRIGPAAIWSGLVVLLFGNLLFAPVMIYGRDVNSYFLPLESAIHRAWAGGRLPLWFAGVSGGKPLLPNPNAGVFYPLRILAAALPFAFGFKLYLVAHIVLGGWGALRLARALGVSRGGQLAAAASYALSGPFVTAVLFSNMLPGLALLPWIGLTGLRLAEGPTLRRAARVAALLALDVLGGEPFTIALALLILAAWAATARPGLRARTAAFAVGAFAAAILAAGVQLVPTLLYLPETFRAQVRFRLLAVLQWSVTPARLLEWIVPYPFGDPTAFLGGRTWGGRFFSGRPTGYLATLFAGAFAAAGLLHPAVRWEDAPRRRALGWFGGLSLLLACAAVFVPDGLLALPMPLPLRYPEKFAFGATLAGALAAGKAWDVARASRRFAAAIAAVAVFLALLAGAAALGRAPLARGIRAWTRGSGATLSTIETGVPRALAEGAMHWALAAAAAALLASSRRRSLSAAALLLVVADLALATRRIVRSAPDADVLRAPPSAAALDRLDPDRRWCFLPEANYLPIPGRLDPARAARPDRPPEITLRAFAGSMWDRPSILNSDPDGSDFARHAFARRDLFERVSGAPGSAARYLAGFSIGWVLRFADQSPLPAVVPAASAGAVTIDRVPDAVPRYSIAAAWREVGGRSDAEDLLRRFDVPPDTAIVETGRTSGGRSASGVIEILGERDSGFEATVSCPAACWLRVPRGPWPFRDVAIDGAPGNVYPERLARTAVPVPPGRHRITWRERVPGGLAGPAVSLVGIVLIVTAARIRGEDSAIPESAQ